MDVAIIGRSPSVVMDNGFKWLLIGQADARLPHPAKPSITNPAKASVRGIASNKEVFVVFTQFCL